VPRVAELEPPGAIVERPLEGPSAPPEQLALQRVAAERRARHPDEGRSSRGEPTWIARATTSCSQPGSASMSTGVLVSATSSIRRPHLLHGGALAGDLAVVERVALLALQVTRVVRELLAQPAVLAHGRELPRSPASGSDSSFESQGFCT
jgi:hypothetical protein